MLFSLNVRALAAIPSGAEMLSLKGLTLQPTGTSLMTSDRRLAGAPARSSRSDSACRTPAYGRLSLVRKPTEPRRYTSACRSAELRPQLEGTCSSTLSQSTTIHNVHSVGNPSRRTRASFRLQGAQWPGAHHCSLQFAHHRATMGNMRALPVFGPHITLGLVVRLCVPAMHTGALSPIENWDSRMMTFDGIGRRQSRRAASC